MGSVSSTAHYAISRFSAEPRDRENFENRENPENLENENLENLENFENPENPENPESLMPVMRRTRGMILRLVRRRAASMTIGAALAIPALSVELSGVDAPWWLEGLSLIIAATGLALFWTGLTGASPDWEE